MALLVMAIFPYDRFILVEIGTPSILDAVADTGATGIVVGWVNRMFVEIKVVSISSKACTKKS